VDLAPPRRQLLLLLPRAAPPSVVVVLLLLLFLLDVVAVLIAVRDVMRLEVADGEATTSLSLVAARGSRSVPALVLAVEVMSGRRGAGARRKESCAWAVARRGSAGSRAGRSRQERGAIRRWIRRRKEKGKRIRQKGNRWTEQVGEKEEIKSRGVGSTMSVGRPGL